jgi:hypothetical protein
VARIRERRPLFRVLAQIACQASGVHLGNVGLIVGLLTQLKTALGISVGIYFVVITSYFFVMATGRLQVRDNGIWLYSRLLRWRKIGSYHWMNESTLLVRPKGRFSLLTQEVFPVPPEHRQAVEKLLAEHCSTHPTA